MWLLKIMMFIFNGCIFMVGAAILGLGIWVTTDQSSLLGLLQSIKDLPPEVSKLANVAYLLIGVGAVLLSIGFLGCCGAMEESRCMLMMFFLIVMLIFISQVVTVVMLLLFHWLAKEVLDQAEVHIISNIRIFYGLSNATTFLWSTVMKQFNCCGYRNYTDFYASPFYNLTSGHYPNTCCNSTVEAALCTEENAKSAVIDGCLFKVQQKIVHENSLIFAAVALITIAIEISAMAVSLILFRGTRKRKIIPSLD